MNKIETFVLNYQNATGRPDEVIALLNASGFSAHLSNEFIYIDDSHNTLPKTKIDEEMSYKVEEVQLYYENFKISEEELYKHLNILSLDHKAFSYNFYDFLEELNKIISNYGLKVIEFDTKSDYVLILITLLDAKTPKDMIRGALKIQGEDSTINNLIVVEEEHPYPIRENKEFTGKEALEFILRNSDIQEQTINFDVLLEFLEENAPEFKYSLVERAGKTFVTIKEFED